MRPPRLRGSLRVGSRADIFSASAPAAALCHAPLSHSACRRPVLPPALPPPPQSPAWPCSRSCPAAERYGAVQPRWQECGWGEAATRAHGEGKFLFVYLHSALHQVGRVEGVGGEDVEAAGEAGTTAERRAVLCCAVLCCAVLLGRKGSVRRCCCCCC
jgi:hypothetical protein